MKWSRYIVVALIVLCATFLVSTVSLYLANDAQQRQLRLSTSASAWVGYQAELAGTDLDTLRGLCADAGQAGKLLRHPRDGFNLPGHG